MPKGHYNRKPLSKEHKEKISLAKRGEKNANWKGGRSISHDGYIVLRVNNKRCYEHRYLLAQHLNRKLRITEHVHHINGIKSDNRIENLELIDASEHAYKHEHWKQLSVSPLVRQKQAQAIKLAWEQGKYKNMWQTRKSKKGVLSATP